MEAPTATRKPSWVILNGLYNQDSNLSVLAETPKVSWAFLAGERVQDKALYCKLQRKSAIWVSKVALAQVKDQSHSVKQYAKRLMWDVIVSVEDLLEIKQLKSRGIGFTKLFGKQHLNSVYSMVELSVHVDTKY